MFWKGVVGLGRRPSGDDEAFFVSADLRLAGGPQTTSLQCFFCHLMKVEPFLPQIFVD